MPSSRWREMFSMTTMASSTTNPVAMVRAMSDRLSSVKPKAYMAAKVPISETGTAITGMSVARALRRKTKTTKATRQTEISRVISTSLNRGADGGGAVENDGEVDALRQNRLQERQLRPDALDGADDVGAGLAKDDHRDGRNAVACSRRCACSARSR